MQDPDLPVAEICRKIVPFLVAGVIALIVITYTPQITCYHQPVTGLNKLHETLTRGEIARPSKYVRSILRKA
jgi:hypothetical protein